MAELQRGLVGSGYHINVGVNPPTDPWFTLAYFMEVVGTLSNSLVGKNPNGFNDAEAMAQYVSQYITQVIMTSTAPNEGRHPKGEIEI